MNTTRQSLSPAKRSSANEVTSHDILELPVLQSIFSTQMELQMLSKLICPITGLILSEPVNIHGSSIIVEAEYAPFISANRSQANEALNTSEFLRIMYSNYPQLRDISKVRYVPARLIRQYQKLLKQGNTEKALAIIREYRGEFLGHIRLRCKIVKEKTILKTIEALQKEVISANKNPGLKWGTRSDIQSEAFNSHISPSQKHIVPEVNLKHASTYCHWLHELFQCGHEQLILEVLDELSSTSESCERLSELLLNVEVPTLPVLAFFHALWTCKSVKVAKKLIKIVTIDALQSKFTKPNIPLPKSRLHIENFHMLLIKAIALNDSDTIRNLIELGADVRATVDEVQATPLNYACRKNKKEIIEILIHCGADINQTMNMGINATNYRPIHYAVQSNLKDLVSILVEGGAGLEDVATFDGCIDMTPLAIAVQNSNYQLVDYLLANGAPTDAPPTSKIAAIPLFLAIENDRDDILALLISHGASCSVTDTKGRNIVHIAAIKNTPSIMKILMEVEEIREELINIKDSFNSTPMEYAAKHNDSSVVRELVSGDKKSLIESTHHAKTSPDGNVIEIQSPKLKSKRNHSSNASSKKSKETAMLLRERVAQLKKKISAMQSKHAAEVEHLENKAKNAVLEARRAKFTVNRVVSQIEEVEQAKSTTPKTNISLTQTKTPSRLQTKSPTSSVHGSRNNSVRKSSSKRSAKYGISVSVSQFNSPSEGGRQRSQTPISRSRTPTNRSTASSNSIPNTRRSKTPTTATIPSKKDEPPKMVSSLNLFKNVKPKVNSYRTKEPVQISEPNEDVQRPLSPLVRHTGHSKAEQPLSPIRKLSPSHPQSPSMKREYSPTLHRSPSRHLAMQSPTMNTQQGSFSPNASLRSRDSLSKEHTGNTDTIVSKFGDLKRLNKSTFSWSIPRSVVAKKQFQEVILSKKFNALGQAWRLKLYPRGAVDQGMISFYIMHEDGDYETQSYTLEYSVEMINEIVPQHEDYRAKNTFRRGEISWGWSHYCASEEMLDPDRGNINNFGFIVFHIMFLKLTENEILSRMPSTSSITTPTQLRREISEVLNTEEFLHSQSFTTSSYTISDSSDFIDE